MKQSLNQTTLCLRAVLFFCLILIQGCKTSSPSTTKARVSPDQFAMSMKKVEELKDFISFQEPSICFARAFYMSLSLASEQIPSSAYFIFPQSPSERLTGPNGLPWEYHVGMMIQATDSQERMIFDPSMSGDPIVDNQWIPRFSHVPVKTAILPGSTYANSAIRNHNHENILLTNFEDMPKFKQVDIESACGILDRFIGSSSNSSGLSYTEKKDKLYSSTIKFVKDLDVLNKIDWGNLTNSSIYCGNQKIFSDHP